MNGLSSTFPLTTVPLPEPWSTSTHAPSALRRSKCLRDTAMSVSTTSLSTPRPTVYVLPGLISSSCPDSLPCVISSRAAFAWIGKAVFGFARPSSNVSSSGWFAAGWVTFVFVRPAAARAASFCRARIFSATSPCSTVVLASSSHSGSSVVLSPSSEFEDDFAFGTTWGETRCGAPRLGARPIA